MKFCGACGKQLEDEAFVCPYCGVKVVDENEGQENLGEQTPTGQAPANGTHIETVDANAFLKKAGNVMQSAATNVQNAATTAATATAVGVKNIDPQKKKKIIIIVASVLAALMVIGAIVALAVNSAKYTKLDMKELFTVEAKGLNGKGCLNGKADQKYLTQQFAKAIGLDKDEMDEIDEDSLIEDLENLLNSDQIKKMKRVEKAFNSLQLADIENDGKLSNGDEVTVKYTYDKDLMKKACIKIKNAEYKYKIQDLTEGTKIDVFEGLKITFTGISPNLKAELDKSGCGQFVKSNVNFSISKKSSLKKDEKITVTASFSQITADQEAVIIDETTREYTVSGGSEYISSIEGIDLKPIEKEINDKLTAYLASNTSIKAGSLNSKHFLKLKDQFANNSYRSLVNNRLIYIYEYQKDDSYSPTIAIAVYVDDIVKDETGALKWDYNIGTNSSSELSQLLANMVNSNVDEYIVTPIA